MFYYAPKMLYYASICYYAFKAQNYASRIRQGLHFRAYIYILSSALCVLIWPHKWISGSLSEGPHQMTLCKLWGNYGVYMATRHLNVCP